MKHRLIAASLGVVLAAGISAELGTTTGRLGERSKGNGS